MNWLTRLLTPDTPTQGQTERLQKRDAEIAKQDGRAPTPAAPQSLDSKVAPTQPTGVAPGTIVPNVTGEGTAQTAVVGIKTPDTQDFEGVVQSRTVGSPPAAAQVDYNALVDSSVKRNPLDQYVNYTYHIKFWLTNESVAEKINNSRDKAQADLYPKVVIAESGVTAGFNISEVTFKNLVGTNRATKNMPSVSWTMRITEPYGMSLPDRINTAARTYGVYNWQRAKYFMQIWFTGYNEHGIAVADGLFHQIYRVTIVDMDLSGSEGGGIYDIKGLFDGMLGYTNDLALQESSIAVSATSVGEFFDKFKEKLNTNAMRLAMGTSPLSEYEIILPDVMKNWKINPKRVWGDDDRSRNMNVKAEGNTVQVVANKGTDFSNLVYYVLTLSDEFRSWNQGSDSQSGGVGVLTHGLSKNVKIHSKVEYIGFDTKAGDYVKKVTYTLVPYEEVRVRGEDIPTIRAAEKRNVQLDKIAYMLRTGRIRKKYEWIYTGQNLDIIKFDFKINNFYTISLVPFGGINTNSNHTQGAIADPESAAWQQRLNQYQKAEEKYKKLNDTSSRLEKDLRTVEAEQASGAKQRGLAALKKDLAEVNRQGDYDPGRYRFIGDDRAAKQAEIDRLPIAQEQLASARGAAYEQQRELEKSRREFVYYFDNPTDAALSGNPVVRSSRTGEARFIADWQAKRQGGERDIFAEDQDVLDIDLTIPFINVAKPQAEANAADFNQGTSSTRQGGNATNPINLPRSRTLFGSVVGNMDSVAKEMINIVLEIRGDPYWMGHSNLDVNNAVPNNLEQLDSNYAEYYGGDNMFYLKFRSGQAPDHSGYMKFNNNNQYVDGYYSVVEVTNTFSQGKFTQMLKSFKDTFSQYGNSVMDKYMQEADRANEAKPQNQTPVQSSRVSPSQPALPTATAPGSLASPTGFASGA